MADNRDHFDAFAPHTLLKHAVLKAYFETWARKLLLRPGAVGRVWYVDAFAGAGMDDAGNHGSPVLAATIAATTAGQIRDMGRGDVEVRTVFFEADLVRCEQLRVNLAPFGERVRVTCGSLGGNITTLLNEIGDDPTLFFLDPFGLRALDASVVRAALLGPRNEVFALFADQAALRHFGTLVADDPDLARELGQLQPGLFDDVNTADERAVRERVSKRVRGLESTRAAAIRILDAAYGSHAWEAAVRAVPKVRRRETFVALYVDLLRQCRAAYVLSLPIRDEDNHHVYHLVHATKSSHGHIAMKEAIETSLRRATLDEAAVATIRFLIRSDLDAVEHAVRTRFAGQTVAWTDAIRAFALAETPAFPSDMKPLQERLRAERQSGRAIVYRFPPNPAANV